MSTLTQPKGPRTGDKTPSGRSAPNHGPLAEQVLTRAQAGRAVIQEFCPLADSLEWELGQQYLRDRGNKAFISDASPVPFIVNNDGALSRNAAAVFFASLVEADAAGSLEPDIFVLELGIGVGLFVRGRSKPATDGRLKTSHFGETRIRLLHSSAKPALREVQHAESAPNGAQRRDSHFTPTRLVPATHCPRAGH